MPNDLQTARRWAEFIVSKCGFPAPERLRAQFESAEFPEFCDCGCNSFKVQMRPGLQPPPIANAGEYGSVFEADFRILEDEKTIEILLFAEKDGSLAYVEVDCSGNNFPVPDEPILEQTPFHVRESNALLR